MSCGSVFSQIKVESIILFLQSQLSHAVQKLVIVVLSLASADDLADSGYKAVNSCHCSAVIILLHIESFDLLRIICDKYRTFVHLLCQIPLMLCLKVASPGNFVLKFIVVLRKDIYCFRVGHSCKI